MKNELEVVTLEVPQDATQNDVISLIHKYITRRDFLVGTAYTGLAVTAFSIIGCGGGGGIGAAAARQVYVANALGMVIGDQTRCVGCRRCEAACVSFNADGIVQPAIANVKINRNISHGVTTTSGMGDFGNFQNVEDTCRQCPHPVKCQLCCPQGAIEVIPPVNARVVNASKCVGCGTCVQACPWAMPSLDGPANAVTTKAHKCTLCAGNPQCVQACPAGALQYVAWSNLTGSIATRQPGSTEWATDVAGTCNQCH